MYVSSEATRSSLRGRKFQSFPWRGGGGSMPPDSSSLGMINKTLCSGLFTITSSLPWQWWVAMTPHYLSQLMSPSKLVSSLLFLWFQRTRGNLLSFHTLCLICSEHLLRTYVHSFSVGVWSAISVPWQATSAGLLFFKWFCLSDDKTHSHWHMHASANNNLAAKVLLHA